MRIKVNPNDETKTHKHKHVHISFTVESHLYNKKTINFYKKI